MEIITGQIGWNHDPQREDRPYEVKIYFIVTVFFASTVRKGVVCQRQPLVPH